MYMLCILYILQYVLHIEQRNVHVKLVIQQHKALELYSASQFRVIEAKLQSLLHFGF